MNWIAIIDHLPALPEAIVLVGACALMIFDLYMKDERRRATLLFAQVILLLAAAATLFVLVAAGRPAKYLIFNGLYIADTMGHLLKLMCYLAVVGGAGLLAPVPARARPAARASSSRCCSSRCSA